MQPTLRLFDNDSHARAFSARVLSCLPTDDGRFDVVLDQTLFFPEAGGQSADTGRLCRAQNPVLYAHVVDVQEENGVLHHMVTVPDGAGAFSAGDEVKGEIDWAPRKRKMQIHSGEHILSGLVFAAKGFHNVGFHLGEHEVTVDFDGVFDRAEADAFEDEANRLIAENHPVRCWYPTADELSTLFYRAKADRPIEGAVRVVQIGEDGCVDSCACCAPHVAFTGEIGMLKILDLIHYKGGVRLWLACGVDALENYRMLFTQTAEIAEATSVRHHELRLAFTRMQDKIAALQATVAELRREQVEQMLARLSPTDGNLCLFLEGATVNQMRDVVNRALPLCRGICAVFSHREDDETVFNYIMGSASVDLKALAPRLNADLHGRGGGTPEMIQGSLKADRPEIENWFSLH